MSKMNTPTTYTQLYSQLYPTPHPHTTPDSKPEPTSDLNPTSDADDNAATSSPSFAPFATSEDTIRWDAIAITANTYAQAQQFKTEMQRRQNSAAAFIHPATIILAIPDPAANVGSGAATLNGLLVVGEHLSAREGKTYVDTELIKKRRILLLHVGGPLQQVPPCNFCGKAFSPLPAEEVNAANLVAPIDILISNVNLLVTLLPPGLLVTSTEAIISLRDIPFYSPDQNPWHHPGVSILTIPVPLAQGMDHGVCKVDITTCQVESIIYKAKSEDALRACGAVLSSGKVLVYSSVVFFDAKTTEILLQLQARAPLDSCTYLGVDNGAEVLHFGLYSDVLLVMASDTNYDDYLNMNTTEQNRSVLVAARKLLWRSLREVELRSVTWMGTYEYLRNAREYFDYYIQLSQSAALYTNRARSSQVLAQTGTQARGFIRSRQIAHSHISVENVKLGKDVVVVNSIITANGTTNTRCLIEHSILSGVRDWRVDDDTLISGVTSHFGSEGEIVFGEKLVVRDVKLSNGDGRGQLLAVSTGGSAILGSAIRVVFGIDDELDVSVDHPNFTIFGKPLKEVIDITDLSVLWPNAQDRTLRNAKLFPILNEKRDFDSMSWMQHNKKPTSAVLQQWAATKRYSVSDLGFVGESSLLVDIASEFSWRRTVMNRVDMLKIEQILVGNINTSLNSVLERCTKDIPMTVLLNHMDNIAINLADPTPPKIGRILSNISDALAYYADHKGGLRSGPARNISWEPAFRLLQQRQYKQAFRELAKERNKWLNSNENLIRAARHYEGALQAVIRAGVETVSITYTGVTPPVPPPSTPWIKVTMPARLDLSGGWSDTPPITYEHGGVVVNMAVKIDGKKPIAALVRRLAEPILVFYTSERGDTPTICTELSELADYAHPMAPAALLKACVASQPIISLENDAPSLAEQLTKLGGGLEVRTVSDLPTGSGLGTSSILAAAILQGVSQALGQTYTTQGLVHGVLMVEQMLTTGGGWQDQIGGMLPSFKIAKSKAALPLAVEFEQIDQPKCVDLLNKHMVLVYTGRTRLARDLLQDVIRRWYARTPQIIQVADGLVTSAYDMRDAIMACDLPAIGKCLDNYWQQKKVMAAGAQPLLVKNMLEALRPHIYGGALAGAGGGGFLALITKKENAVEVVKAALAKVEDAKNATFHRVEVDTVGMEVTYEATVEVEHS